MSELSKFINLIIEYGQKIQSCVNKKYKSFIRSICHLQQLAKTVNPNNIVLTKQIIIFKLGLQSKSTKSIETSLIYLHKLFVHKFIDLNQPNFCQQFQIQQNTVRKKQNINIKNEIRFELLRLLQPLIHFKNNQINQLLYKVYEYLITQPIAPILIQLNNMTPSQHGQKILYNYFNYRFYIFQEIYTFTQAQFKSINPLSIRNQKINQQIQQSFINHQNLLDLVHKYVGQIVAAVAKIGGKYGLCVICKESADYYCKITKASLCGAQCKKKHLELAEKQYKMYYQSVNLWKQIEPNFKLLLQSLTIRQSGVILNVVVSLLEKAHLFMIVKKQFRAIIGTYVPAIVNNALNYKDQSSFQIFYNFIAVLCRFWMLESVSSIQYFFKQSLLKILQDKKPSFKLIIIVFKTLAKIFQYGKTTIQLYVNFDCQLNKTNILQRVMFELSRICQDKFASILSYNKNQKITLRNSAVTLLSILSKGLNEYRLMYSQQAEIEQILSLKQRKTNLQKFLMKFNEHWSDGLKILFNLNMLGLDSQTQIIDIFLQIKGLRKDKIQDFLLSQNGRQYINNLFNKITLQGPFMGLIQLFRIIPLSNILQLILEKSSILLKHYTDYVLKFKEQNMKNEIDQDKLNVMKWAFFLNTNYKLAEFKTWIQKQQIEYKGSLEYLFMKCTQTKSQTTLGRHKIYFRHCISQTYLQVLASQLSLLQIPILFLIETQYSHQKIFQIIGQLIQICPHANWITLCLKSIDLQKFKTNQYTAQDYSLIRQTLKLTKNHSQFINDWQTVLMFLCKLHKIIINSDKQKIIIQSDQNSKIKSQIKISDLQQYLLLIGNNLQSNFQEYINSLINLSQQQLQKQNVFFLQKTFEIIQQNLPKFIKNINFICQQIQKLIKRNIFDINSQTIIKQTSQKKINYSTQTMIYISDMLKQLFAKVLKPIKKQNQYQKSDIDQEQKQKMNLNVQSICFKLFSCILEQNNNQVNDFVMNSISMLIMHQYNLQEQTWTYIISVLKQYCSIYRQQTLTILQKIAKEKLLNCQNLQFQIINLCLQIVNQKQIKISIQSINLLKDFFNIMLQQCNNYSFKSKQKLQQIQQNQLSQNNENEQNKKNKLNQYGQNLFINPKIHPLKKARLYLKFIIQNLIQFISYDCHQGAIQILFTLLKTKSPHKSTQFLLNNQVLNEIINKIYQKLGSLPKNLVVRGQKIMNQSLFWSVRNKHYAIIKNLQNCIIDNYSSLSYAAMKCIKTFISMTNPKKSQDWNPIQETLVKILKNTHLSDFIYENYQPKILIENMIQKDMHLQSNYSTQILLSQISNKLIIQRMVVQVLPNDVKIMNQILKIYKQTVTFNDDIYLRCLLWRQGLGASNKQSPPDILSLQELISYRIISTYYWSKDYQKIAQFTLQILQRYSEASNKWQQLELKSQSMQKQASNKTYELYSICRNYWQKRRNPLKVIINYMLPKLPKICKEYKQKQRILYQLIQGMKYSQERSPFIQTIKALTLVR